VPEDEDLFAALYRGEKGGGVPAELGECHLFHGDETTLYINVHFTPLNVKGGSDAQLEDGRAGRIFSKWGQGLSVISGIERRFGLEAVRVFERDIVPVLKVVWVTRDIHEAAVGAQLAAGRRGLSLVDCASFEIMRRAGIQAAFAYDPHFEEYGYEVIPDTP
jgi:predicted nucleic acid-binding protein